jgi:exopolysaccharide biosynthesis polyprenyl glycosylphosphotransferase
VLTDGSNYLPHRKVALAMADAVLVPAAIMLTVALRLGSTSFQSELGGHALALLLVWLVVFPTFYLFGLYDTDRLDTLQSLVVPAFGCSAVAGLVDAAVLRVALPPAQAVVSGLVATGFIFTVVVGVRIVHLLAAHRGVWSSRVLVVGTRSQVREISALLDHYPRSGLRVVGMVDVRCEPEHGPQVMAPYETLGQLVDLDRLSMELRVDKVVLGAGLERDPEVLRRLRPVRYRGAAVLDFVTLYERLAHEISITHIDDAWLFAAAMNSSRLHARWMKRLTDLVAGTLLLVPTVVLVLPFAALAIKLTSKGPVFFRQERLGLGARPFMLLKLRTMRLDAEALTGPVWSSDNDPRITSAGRWLRKFRIDELPQLWNVMVGDMSLIGPRPEREVFVRELSAKLPLFSERLLVRPGITGWAQVMAPYASSIEDSYRKLQFDLYYAKHMSLFLDGIIVVKTMKTMMLGRERQQGGMAAGKQLARLLDTAKIPRAAITVPMLERAADGKAPAQLDLVG